MTKQSMADSIQFALDELSNTSAELDHIIGIQLEDSKPGEYYGEAIARTLGRAEGMAANARMWLAFAVKTLKEAIEGQDTEPSGLASPATANETSTSPKGSEENR